MNEDILEDWKLGTVTRAIEYCPHCQQQTRCGVMTFDDGSVDTLHVKHMHRDGSFADKFIVGARIAQRKDSPGVSLFEVLLKARS